MLVAVRLSRALPALLLLIASAPLVVAQEARYELGRRLRELELAWDDADAGAKARALPALRESVTCFFGLRMKDAARALDRARFAIGEVPTDGVAAWCASFVVRPAWRLAATGDSQLAVTCAPYYDLEVPAPEGVRVLLELTDAAQTLVAGPQERALVASPAVESVLELKTVEEGDYRLRARFLLEDRAVNEVTVNVSLADDLQERLAALERGVEAAPRPLDLERATAQRLHGMLARLLDGKVPELDVRGAALLREAEAALAAETARYDFRHEGDQWLQVPAEKGPRALRLYAPPFPEGAADRPCVLALHGAGGSDHLFFEGYGHGAAVRLARERGWVFVAPKAPLFGGGGDLRPLLDALAGRYRIDRQRVLLLGHSMGAAHALSAARKAPEAYAAMALIGGGRPSRRDEVYAELPTYVAAGSEDFGLRGARAFHASLVIHQPAARLDVREGIEHLTIVQEVLPAAYAFFDEVLGEGR